VAKGENHQVAALPVRIGANARPEILLITSRERHRWIIPKGWPMKDRSDAEAAEIEAFEEAGLIGKMEKAPIGSYDYVKLDDAGRGKQARVDVYVMNVTGRHKTWPEQNQRLDLWVDIDEALILLDEPDLAALLERVRGKLG
jgi:8-oxo-dGTP pyrophosphatase MutT (NUDIX family)